MKEAAICFLIGLLLIGGAFGGGFILGKKLGSDSIMRQLPAQFDKLCFQCAEEGRKQGYNVGLKTCDDLLDVANNKGAY